jgi:hypothetical protein
MEIKIIQSPQGHTCVNGPGSDCDSSNLIQKEENAMRLLAQRAADRAVMNLHFESLILNGNSVRGMMF